MKRFALYLGMTAAMVASCSNQEEDFKAPQKYDGNFYAYFEQPSGDMSDHLLRWTADDRVSLFNKITYNQQYKFLGETGDYEGEFTKAEDAGFVTGNEIPHVISVYPYQESMKISEEEALTLTLPAEQHYAENTYDLGANTLVSVSEDNNLQFKNMDGYLWLSLYGEGVSVSSITLKGNNGEKLAGKATVTMPLDGVPTAEMANDATEEITLVCDTPVVLGATAEGSKTFWFVVPPVTFSEGFTVSVNQTTGGVFEKSTTKSITIERNRLFRMSPFEVGGASATPIPDAVDLGLPSGLKWASFNLGASKPEEYGDYYAWGETEPKYESIAENGTITWTDKFGWSSYKWCMGSINTMTKYCSNSEYGYNGFTDTKVVLDSEDDAASVNLGDKWRMPTYVEFDELLEKCSWEWTQVNGINGRKVTGPNGNSIFLPAAGYRDDMSLYNAGSYGFYWSSSLEGFPYDACCLYFDSGDVGWHLNYRYNGYSVRPVTE